MRRAILVATLVTTSACPTPPGPAEPVNFVTLVDTLLLAQERCGVVYGATPFIREAEPNWVRFVGEDAARSRDALIDRFQRESANTRVETDRAAYVECLRALEDDENCGELTHDDGFPRVCGHVLRGTQALGAPCGSDVECPLDAFCTIQILSPCGVCRRRADLGESCEQTPCREGLACGVDVRCVDEADAPPPPQLGDECVPLDDRCGFLYDTGLYCDFQPGDDVGHCAPARIGDEGAICDRVGRVCKDSFTSTFCAIDSTARTGVCLHRPILAEMCTPTPGCDETQAMCTNGSCRPWADIGEACAPGDPDAPLCDPLSTCDLQGGPTGTCASTIALNYAAPTPQCD